MPNIRSRAMAVLLAVLASACAATSEPDPTASPDPQNTNAVVTRVVDGDTVEVRFGGESLTVRLIGIDTPESVAPGEPVECFALRASAYTEERLEGEGVRLEFDVERIDPFGRTLAYVWLGDELFNETLLREGFALVTTFPPNVVRRSVPRRSARGSLAGSRALGRLRRAPPGLSSPAVFTSAPRAIPKSVSPVLRDPQRSPQGAGSGPPSAGSWPLLRLRSSMGHHSVPFRSYARIRRSRVTNGACSESAEA
jgi:micrococcal nuclease